MGPKSFTNWAPSISSTAPSPSAFPSPATYVTGNEPKSRLGRRRSTCIDPSAAPAEGTRRRRLLQPGASCAVFLASMRK